MKIIAIGDIHGRGKWREIVSKEPDADKIVFIGNYFDSKEDIATVEQIYNFNEIIEFKKQNIDKVVLLFGNHDFHYLRTSTQHYSGFQRWHISEIGDLIHKAIDNNYLQMCYIHDKFLFSHAGVTKTWCRNNGIDLDNLQNSINDLFFYKPNCFQFTPGDVFNHHGDEICQTPIWVRPNSLLMDKLDGYTQVVGHTMQPEITWCNGVVFIDTLGTSGKHLSILDGGFNVDVIVPHQSLID